MNIAFIGRAAAGKTTCSDYLVEHHGYTRVGFADPLRALGTLHSTRSRADWGELVNLWSYQYRLNDVLPSADVVTLCDGIRAAFDRYPVVAGKNRALLQNIGTEVGRGIDDSLWVRLALNRAEQVDGPVTLDDCRFDNEARALKQAGWLLCYVHATEAVRDARYAATYGAPMTDEQKAHSSETGIAALRDLCDYCVHNSDDDTGTLYSELYFLKDYGALYAAGGLTKGYIA